jgi:FkbM family methyltransferase
MKTTKILNDTGRIYYAPFTDDYMIRRLSKGVWGKSYIDRIKLLMNGVGIRHTIDVGGNLGQSTVEFAQISQRVTMFEPVGEVYKLAVKNILANQPKFFPETTVSALNLAVGEKAGEVQMTARTTNVGMNRILTKKPSKGESVSTIVVTLDSLNLTEVDFIKIDVEGYEYFVLKGATKLIESQRPIVQTELIASHLANTDTTCQDIQNWFFKRGYVRVLKSGRILTEETFVELRNPGDSFWVPKEKLHA